jgi:DNA-binding PadR family transcriptional regulator
MSPSRVADQSHIPLAPHVYHILIALQDRALHGYALIKAIEEQSGGTITLGTSTLYAAVNRLLDDGLIIEADRPPGMEFDDPRRRYYTVTPLGRRVTKAEAARIRALDQLATKRRLVPTRGR